jgi:hypothetical protein
VDWNIVNWLFPLRQRALLGGKRNVGELFDTPARFSRGTKLSDWIVVVTSQGFRVPVSPMS